ncbi:MAG: adenylosuccinate synthase [Acidobacteria bacterium]|nr:MAG: adenylosuccinate synthase [Acidobacteriota bacterium]
MPNIVIVGMQWGDEGKGKVVDLLCPAFAAVARYQGGNNAGHTVKFGDRHYALHLIPSGILHPGLRCYLGNGMVLSPRAFEDELGKLEASGVAARGRLFVSDRAQVVSPMHGLLDRAREGAAGDRKIGTTSRGIGPAYESKVSRLGLRVVDLGAENMEERVLQAVERARRELEHLLEGDLAGESGAALDADAIVAECRSYAEVLAPFVCDVAKELNEAIDRGESVLFEGAQGALLDVDHGTYPFVTSSNSTSGGACTGTGVPPTRIDGVVGILKAYSTRVGAGPFPTELDDAFGERLRSQGGEFGTTTGRPRRCGWMDLVVARYARRVNGVGSIALTKLDVLDGLEEIKVCTGYRIDGEEVSDLPADASRFGRAEPVYERLPGWNASTVGARSFADLPPNARSYVRYLEEQLGVGIDLISTGPRREETIIGDRLLREWLGEELDLVTSQMAVGAG